MTDKRGFLLEIGMEVNVPDPNEDDTYHYSFNGTIVDILDDRGTAIVEDGDSEFFEVECDRLTIEE